jgi:hypothetical protein
MKCNCCTSSEANRFDHLVEEEYPNTTGGYWASVYLCRDCARPQYGRGLRAGKSLLFVSRHTPTEEQLILCFSVGYELVHVGDVDAFQGGLVYKSPDRGQADGAVIVHAALAMRYVSAGWGEDFIIGVFQSASRPAEGGKASFELAGLWTYCPLAGEKFYPV